MVGKKETNVSKDSTPAEPVPAPETPEAPKVEAPDTTPPPAEPAKNTDGLLSVAEVVDQVLAGRWGSTAKTASNRLEAVGYDVAAVAEEFERRKAAGAPSAF
jgi:hypothetical protein